MLTALVKARTFARQHTIGVADLSSPPNGMLFNKHDGVRKESEGADLRALDKAISLLVQPMAGVGAGAVSSVGSHTWYEATCCIRCVGLLHEL